MTEASGADAARVVDRILGNLHDVRERIAAVGRDDVRIVAVTKHHSPLAARAAVAAGLADLGENYAGELIEKADATRDLDIRWHFIGQLQSNKVRSLVGRVAMYHTVDRTSLVDELARREAGAIVLIQVDLAGIEGRGGCHWDAAEMLVQQATEAGLVVCGLMGVGRPGSSPEDVALRRQSFDRLAALQGRLGLAELSLGMSGDLEDALAAGSTMVRIGTAIFGARG